MRGEHGVDVVGSGSAVFAAALMAFFIAGCGDSDVSSPSAPLSTAATAPPLTAPPSSPPPTSPPPISASLSLRPYYDMGTGESFPAGTAFVIADADGKLYMITAAHIMDDEAEWREVQSVTLKTMTGEEVARTEGVPSYIGRAFDVGDSSTDSMVWPLAPGAKVEPISMKVTEGVQPGDWVWVVGQEPGDTGPQKTYLCQVTQRALGGYLLKASAPFEMRGFSGGPVVDAKGEVVGTLLGGGGPDQILISIFNRMKGRLIQAGFQSPK